MLYLPSWQSFHYFLDFITEQFIQHLSILQIVMHSFDFAKILKVFLTRHEQLKGQWKFYSGLCILKLS